MEPLLPKAKGRPKATAVDEGLDLGFQRPRVMASKKAFVDEQRMEEMERRLELLETVHAHGVVDEKVQTALLLHEEAEAEDKQLRGLLLNRGSSDAFEAPDRKPSQGQLSLGGYEIPLEGLGRCEAAGQHFWHPRGAVRQP